MSFIGLVTRKEEDTGVSLVAKVVTPSKKKSAKKTFKVKVKANNLDDFSCCVIDHATAKSAIEGSQDLSAVVNDFEFVYNGVNGTSIAYKLIDTTTPGISSYITEDGKLSHRPKFGDNTVSGYIEITVSKGEAQVQSRIIITLQPLTSEEILNDSNIISDAVLWNYIRNGNSAQNNIVNNLNLITSIETEKSAEPITIEYTVTDNTLAYSKPYNRARIDATTGQLTRPSYKDACAMVETHKTTDINVAVVNTADNGAMGRCIRIGGLKLVAKATLGETIRTISYNLSTLSMYITCLEVLNVVAKQICMFRQDYTKMEYCDDADQTTFETITAPASGGTTKVRAYYGAVAESFSCPELLLEANDILGVNVTNQIKAHDGGEYPSAGMMATAFSGGFVQEADGDGDRLYYDALTIDFNAINSASDELKKFAVFTTIKASGYSTDGRNPQGGQMTQTRKIRFKVNTAAMSVNSGGSTSET